MGRSGKARLEAIDVELTQITTKFSENVLDATNAFGLFVTDLTEYCYLPSQPVGFHPPSPHAQRSVLGMTGFLQHFDFILRMTVPDPFFETSSLVVLVANASSSAVPPRGTYWFPLFPWKNRR